MSEEEYEIDAFADGSRDAARADLVKNFNALENSFQTEMAAVEDALDESLYKRWDALTDPCDLSVEPYEQISMWQVAAGGDIKLLNKIFLVFGSLCKEIAFLQKSSDKYVAAFLAYGLFDEADEGRVQIQVGRMLELLAEMETFVARCFTVLHNVIVQLGSLYSAKSELYRTTFRLVHMQSVFEYVGRLLVTLITLDRVIECNDIFHDHWAQYKRMTEDVKKNPAQFGVEPEKVFRLQKMLLHLEGKLLSQALYSDAVQQEFDIEGFVDARGNTAFQKEFAFNIATMQTELLGRLGKGDSLTNQRRYMSLCALHGLFLYLFRQPLDAKNFATFWEVHKVIPVVPLEGRTWWWPTEFLEAHCGVMVGSVKAKARQEVAKTRADVLKSRDAALKGRLHELHGRASVWLSRMESNLSEKLRVQDIIIERIALLRDGLTLANAIAAELRVVAALHMATQRPWAPEHVTLLCKAGGLLKAVQQTFHRRSAMMGETISYMIEQVQGALSQQFSRLKADVQSGRRQDDARLDVLAALNFALSNVVVGPASSDRRILLRLAMHVFLRSDIGKKEELSFVSDNMSTLEVVCNIREYINSACSGSVLFWIRSMVPAFFGSVFRKPDHAHRLQYVLACLSDALPVLKRAVHTDGALLCSRFADEIQSMVRETIMEPVARDIDVELRFHVHAHLGVQKDRDPFKLGVRHLVALVRLRPLLFYDRSLDIRAFVEHYLDRLYYDEVAVTQHKWRGFEEQRNLAREKYGLTLTDSLLPGQTLDNELDVLQIMRLIHVFVRSYHYNLNNQIFVQHESEGKNLNSINVDIIAESIRTHGIGIMNTTVNFTFQFLKQRFITFSQFLFDDHISGRLYKDGRFFKAERARLNNCYPYDRADKFNKEIRKLGVDKGLSYLDKFRLLITEIGNAMGYIRMIRTAGHHFISSAIQFVPDLQHIPVFEDSALQAGLSRDTQEAAKILDSVISNLSEHFSVGTEYFVTLVNVFAKEFRDPKNKHLKLFYLICPPLLVNHVEYMVAAKDRVGKKGRAGENAVWTEDGLPLGIAYILKLLDQESDHESLHFFESAQQLYQSSIDKIKHEIAGMHKRRQAEEIQARTATLNRLEKFLREFTLVRFAFTGAKTFFLFADEAAKTAEPAAAASVAGDEGAVEGGGAAGGGGGQDYDEEEDSTYQESESGAAYF